MHSTNRRFLRKRYVIPSIVAAVALAGGGIAFAYFTSAGSGTGSAQVGSPAQLTISQLGTPMYNSRIPAPTYQWSQCFYCVQMGEFGNAIDLANGGGPLSNVVVDMANFGATAGSMDITLNIYNPRAAAAPGNGAVPGSLIATDEQSVSVPAAPDGGNGSTYCQTGAGSSNPWCGIVNFTVVFPFSSQNNTLPGAIVYGIQYNDGSNDVNGGVNVQLSNETTQVSVGSDADPGYLFADLASATAGEYAATYNDVGPGEITCASVGTVGSPNPFGEYPTAAGSSCGFGPPAYVPAVEFDTSMNLYPGGPAQPIGFRITNTGSVPETVSSVAIAVAYDVNNSDVEAVPGYTSTDVAGCNAGWFNINGSPVNATVTVDQTVPANGSIDVVGYASISMTNEQYSQDQCKDATVGLTFTSS